MSERFIGLMSGTSLDGIDAVLVAFDGERIEQQAALCLPFSAEERQMLESLCQPGDNEIARLALADPLIARKSADAINTLLQQQQLKPDAIRAIGSHGQTVRHYPELGYTLQIGDPSLLAELTGITVVADFRRRDLAAGGQGAPLVPAFHAGQFRSSSCDRVIVNIGGISNISVLPKNQHSPVLGFDTGPGNLLLDDWYARHQQGAFDTDGAWAARGRVQPDLLARWLEDDYIRAPFPKSTGRERFNPEWLAAHLSDWDGRAEDIQATLCRFTAASIARGITLCGLSDAELYLCGGGAYNGQLRRDLAEELPGFTVMTTEALGIAPCWVEAVAFAWLARRTLNGQSGNLPSATRAMGARILGGIYPASAGAVRY